jgi:hypothetical protein
VFLSLLFVTLLIAALVSGAAALAFNRPVTQILARIIADPISDAWRRYLHFAILVVGISAGVRIHELERYITANQWVKDSAVLQLTRDRWVLEVYRTIIGSLQGIAWLMLVFFVIALIAYVIVRIAELRRERTPSAPHP